MSRQVYRTAKEMLQNIGEPPGLPPADSLSAQPTKSHTEAREVAQTHARDMGHQEALDRLAKIEANIRLLRQHILEDQRATSGW